ncbi:MAG TPA: hypothetical protein VK125_07235 [Bacillota bacterium]|nr:hypothetical protein [Bacillota bacterium]
MEKQKNVASFEKLYRLLNYYYENRDQPVESNFDFFKEVEALCLELQLDFETFKKTFHL